jgi:anti-anti-sigma factor
MSETSNTHLAVERTPEAVVAVVRCEKVGGREAQILEADLRKAATAGRWRMVIDLAEVTLLASMGLGMLVTMHKEAAANGGKLAICGLRPEIQQLLKITHLERVLKIHDDRVAALKAVT